MKVVDICRLSFKVNRKTIALKELSMKLIKVLSVLISSATFKKLSLRKYPPKKNWFRVTGDI